MSFFDLLFPKKCLECGVYGKYMCDSCVDKIGAASYKEGENLAIFRYEGVARKAILALKYRFAYDIANDLAEVCAERLTKGGFKIKAILVPVPLHKSRNNWRGFNQSQEVGKILAKNMDWKFVPNFLIKSVQTKTQVGLKGEERANNLKGSFGLNTEVKIRKDSQIIAFDDVYTTGSTMKEAIKTLKDNGFSRVLGITIAS